MKISEIAKKCDYEFCGQDLEADSLRFWYCAGQNSIAIVNSNVDIEKIKARCILVQPTFINTDKTIIYTADPIEFASVKIARLLQEDGCNDSCPIKYRLCDNYFLGDNVVIGQNTYIGPNGSLLNQDIIVRKFTDWNIKDMQVTLDGTSEVYESTKKYIHPEEGEFYSILNNIRLAAQAGVFINIRLNIGKTNQNSILALLKELDKIYARYENVVFYPAFLTGEADPMTEEERVGFVKKMLLSLKNIKKLTASTKFYSLPRMHACMNGDPQSFSIDVNGNVYSCEHFVGHEEERIGTIEDMFRENDSRGKDVSFRKECQDCVFLPKCFGGCEANWIEGENPCMIEKYLIKSYLQIL